MVGPNNAGFRADQSYYVDVRVCIFIRPFFCEFENY